MVMHSYYNQSSNSSDKPRLECSRAQLWERLSVREVAMFCFFMKPDTTCREGTDLLVPKQTGRNEQWESSQFTGSQMGILGGSNFYLHLFIPL